MEKTLTYVISTNKSDIKNLRDGICHFLQLHEIDEKTIENQTRILNVLLNICKFYSGSLSVEQNVTVKLISSKNQILIQISNHVIDSQEAELINLDKTIQCIRGYHNPFEAYLKIKSRSNKIHEINLAKLAYENKTELDFFVTKDNILNMSSIGTIS